MTERDLYGDLGVERGASADEVKKAYRRLARELHPDRNPGNKRAEERFKRVGHAYEVLSSPEKRALYDEFGEMGLRDGFNPEWARRARSGGFANGGFAPNGPGPGGFSFEDVFRGGAPGGFEAIFGEAIGGRRTGRRERGGIDVESEITLGLGDALRGAERELTIRSSTEPERTIRVRIPPGAEDGRRLRLRGQGGARRPDGPRGDLLLTVRIEPHPHYWREGNDLHVTVPVKVQEVFDGAKLTVPTADGDVIVRVPPRARGGQKLRVRGRGIRPAEGEPGDLFVHLSVRLPSADTAKVAEAIRVLEQAYGDEDVRADLLL